MTKRAETGQNLVVCYFGTYRATYSRNQIMLAGLRAAGVEVVECHVPLWRGIEDRVEVAGGQWRSLGFVKRMVSVYKQLLAKYRALDKNYDVMVVGYPGQLDVFLARLLSWWQGKPLALDLFMSIYLIAQERGLAAKSPLGIRLLGWLEALGCRLPNLLICDTAAYMAWHQQTHGLNSKKFRLVPTGADDRFFKPVAVEKPNDGKFRVLYYGTFIPNHGVETIIEAANLLKTKRDICFELVGEGPVKSAAEHLAAAYQLNNVTFTAWLEKSDLPQKIAAADLLLGVFGTTPQSLMTVQNKIYEGLAMAKPVITGDAPVVRAALQHQVHIYLVERAKPQALAEAIVTLQADPALRQKLSEEGQACFNQHFSIERLGFRFKEHLLELC